MNMQTKGFRTAFLIVWTIILQRTIVIYQTMKNLYLGQKIKTLSSSSIQNNEIMNSSADQSRADSNSKRFSRKQGPHLENGRACKTPKMVDLKIKRFPEDNKPAIQPKKPQYITSGFIRQEDLYLKISSTTSKRSLYASPISTDRNTESTALTKPNEKDLNHESFDIPTTKKKNFEDVEQELELKMGEIMMLEDENLRLKAEIGHLESEHLKMRLNQQKQYQLTVKQLKEEIEALKNELFQKNQIIKRNSKTEATLNRELKGIKYDKLILEKQLEEIYKKRVPKEFRDLMSFRELALMKQVEELREELEKEKTEKEKLMEAEIIDLKHQHDEKKNIVKKLEIQSHVLSKKVLDTEESLRMQQEQFKECFSNLKETNTNLVDQLKRTRKENLKLQRLNVLTQQGKRKTNYQISDESDTLSISISPRSPRDL